MEIRLEISQKIIDDAYVDRWVWRIINENRDILDHGEEANLVECYEPARASLKKHQKKHEKNSLKDISSVGGL